MEPLADRTRAALVELEVAGLPCAFPPARGIEDQTIKEQFVEPQRRCPYRLLGGAAALAIAIAAVAGYLLTRGGGVTVVGNSLAAIDPGTDRIVSDLRVGQLTGSPGVAVGAGSVWVVNQGDGTVSRVAVDSGRVTRTIHVGGAPNSVAVSAGRVWVSVD